MSAVAALYVEIPPHPRAQTWRFAILAGEARIPTVKVTLERLPESRVSLDIEVDPERVEQSLNVAYKRLAPGTRVPGFRPGKAPRQMIERQIGRQRLMNEALDVLVPQVYNEAIESEDVDAIAQPELEAVELEPVRLKFTVPIRPTVDVGDYKNVRVEKPPVEVSDEQITEQIESLRKRHATQVPVERPIEWGDILIADVKGEFESESFVQDDDAEFQLRKGEKLLVDGLGEAFVGMSKGEDKAVDLPLPDDFQLERMAGKTATFTIHVREVKEEQLPDLDDEFANLVNADEFPDLATLTARIRQNLTEQQQQQVDAEHQDAIVEKMVEGATIEFPRVLVDREIDHLMRQSLGGSDDQYASYLQRLGKSEAEFREVFREGAEMRVKRALLLSEISAAEALEVSDDEIAAEIETMATPMGDDAERFKEMFGTDDGQATIRRNLLNRKLVERISAIAAGEAKEDSA